MTKEEDNVRNSYLAIKATPKQSCEDADVAKAFQLGLDLGQKIGYCKDCKYFEYDSVAKVNGIPLIVAHEICSRWGEGCKTKEDGFCFLYEPKTQEGDKNDT